MSGSSPARIGCWQASLMVPAHRAYPCLAHGHCFLARACTWTTNVCRQSPACLSEGNRRENRPRETCLALILSHCVRRNYKRRLSTTKTDRDLSEAKRQSVDIVSFTQTAHFRRLSLCVLRTCFSTDSVSRVSRNHHYPCSRPDRPPYANWSLASVHIFILHIR